MCARLGCWSSSRRKGRNFYHMHSPVQGQGDDRSGLHLNMAARNLLTIQPDMALFEDFLGKAAGLGQSGKE